MKIDNWYPWWKHPIVYVNTKSIWPSIFRVVGYNGPVSFPLKKDKQVCLWKLQLNIAHTQLFLISGSRKSSTWTCCTNEDFLKGVLDPSSRGALNYCTTSFVTSSVFNNTSTPRKLHTIMVYLKIEENKSTEATVDKNLRPIKFLYWITDKSNTNIIGEHDIRF